MSTDNVTPLPPRGRPSKPSRSANDIFEVVTRAKQIVRAVRIAQEHDVDEERQYDYALDQVEDMLDRAGLDLSELADHESRKERQEGAEGD